MANEFPDSMKRAQGRYTRSMIGAALAYAAVLIAAALAIRNLELPQWAVIALALAPVAPALLMLRAYLRFVNEIDEFHRRIQSEAVMIAAGIVGFGSLAYGFLEEWAGFPHLPLIWVLPALMFAYGVTACVVRARYRD